MAFEWKSNEAWNTLCATTTELLPQFGSRPAAFQEACRQRPDLAATAIDPMGKPVTPQRGTPAGETRPSRPIASDLSEQPTPQSLTEQFAACANSPLVKACEQLAGGCEK